MRLIYDGPKTHALQLLQDSGTSRGINADLRAIMDELAAWPHFKHAHFVGDVVLTVVPPRGRPDAQGDDPLFPTMRIEGVALGGFIHIDNFIHGMDKKGIITSVTDPTPLKPMGCAGTSFVFQANTVFKAQTDFHFQTLEFSQRKGLSEEEKGTRIEIETKSGKEMSVIEVRIYDCGYGRQFGVLIAERAPHTKTLIYPESRFQESSSWESLREGWDWNSGNPRLLPV